MDALGPRSCGAGCQPARDCQSRWTRHPRCPGGLTTSPALLFALLLAVLGGKILAQAVPEYEVKAAFLLNFTKFVEWPPSAFSAPDSPMILCVLGDDPFGAALDEVVRGETVNGRPLMVQRMTQVPAPRTCHVVYLSVPGRDLPKVLRSLGPGVLTVGEGASFIRDGGMIAFVIDNRRVRFSVNQTVAANAGLRLSSRLLAVAKAVEK